MESTDNGVWVIEYRTDKLRFATERTDRDLVSITPHMLDAMLVLVNRPASDSTRELVNRYWPISDGF